MSVTDASGSGRLFLTILLLIVIFPVRHGFFVLGLLGSLALALVGRRGHVAILSHVDVVAMRSSEEGKVNRA